MKLFLWTRRACLALFVCSTAAWAQVDGSGLQTSVAVDIVGSFQAGSDSDAKDLLNVREAEIALYAPIDHLFEGNLSLAAHLENGVSLFEVHEATISSSKLIPRSSFKIGQFFLGVGRLNRFHRHDWLFVSAPKVHAQFFDAEGVLDTGAEYSFLLPTSMYVNLTIGVTNGWVFGHAHDEGEKPSLPTHYARLSTFLEPSESSGFAFGANYLSRKSDEGTKMDLFGLDGIAKWSAGSYNSFLVQGEAWYRVVQPKLGQKQTNLGAYLYPQYGFSQNVFLGCRLDYFSVMSLKDATGSKLSNADYAVVPTLTYKSSEFATFKIAYNHEIRIQEHQSPKTNKFFEIQSTFILGAHPAHDF